MLKDKVIDGRRVAADVRRGVAEEIHAALERRPELRPPSLVTVLVGDDPASQVYLRIKAKACAEVGVKSRREVVPASISLEELKEFVKSLSDDPLVDGVLVQLPLPGRLRAHQEEVVNVVAPDKDVDGFTHVNNGRLAYGDESMAACTPKGIVHLLEVEGVELDGAEVVVINRSNVVGKPLALLLLNRNATVTVCHSRTRELPKVTSRADVLVVAIGRPLFVTPEFVKDGAVVVDVGTNRHEGKLVGDCHFDALLPHVSKITPVPGGVGPMTVATLLRNTLHAWKLHVGL